MTFAEDNRKAWNEIHEMAASRPQEFDAVETVNGPGATMVATGMLRERLPALLERYDITSVLDIGCGDWNWMRDTDLGRLQRYIGWDVDTDQMCINQEKYGSATVTFDTVSALDIEHIPTVDLIIARHVLIHFPNDHICALLRKLAASGSTYLLTSHWSDGSNEDYDPEGFAWRGYMERALNMEAPPFDLPPHIDAIAEPAGPAGVLRDAHQLTLYRLAPPPNECGHLGTHRVHRANGTVATLCNTCQRIIDERAEAGGMFSVHDTLARWHRDINDTGSVGGSTEPARVQMRPLRNVEVLRGLRDEHRELLTGLREGPIAASMEVVATILKAHVAIIDAILDELIGAAPDLDEGPGTQ